jgi:hypothetical protein
MDCFTDALFEYVSSMITVPPYRTPKTLKSYKLKSAKVKFEKNSSDAETVL